ncbi:24659_t:CDS:2, partial [Gigaspora rosea]
SELKSEGEKEKKKDQSTSPIPLVGLTASLERTPTKTVYLRSELPRKT